MTEKIRIFDLIYKVNEKVGVERISEFTLTDMSYLSSFLEYLNESFEVNDEKINRSAKLLFAFLNKKFNNVFVWKKDITNANLDKISDFVVGVAYSLMRAKYRFIPTYKIPTSLTNIFVNYYDYVLGLFIIILMAQNLEDRKMLSYIRLDDKSHAKLLRDQ